MINQPLKKILHLQTELNIACGVSKNMYLIIKYSDQSYKHFVAALGGDGFDRFHSLNIFPEKIPKGIFSILKLPGLMIYIIMFCKKNKIDIIHSHHRRFDSIAWVISKFFRINTVMSVQSKVYGKKMFSYKSNFLIACSKTIQNHLINYFKIEPGRIQIIYNCVDTKEINTTQNIVFLRKGLQISNLAIVIGYFGRFSFEEKGLDLLLKVFSELILEVENLLLFLIGSGPDENAIMEFDKKFPGRIKILKSQTDLSNYFRIIDIFILPSRVDPFPLVMLECGFFKRPFIGSKVDGIAELIRDGENGLLFEKEDTKGLKNCIVKLIKDKKFADQLAQNLHDEIMNKYSANIIIPKYYSLYDSITTKSIIY